MDGSQRNYKQRKMPRDVMTPIPVGHVMVALSLPTGYNRWSSPPNLDSNCLISSCEATVYLRSTKTPRLSKHIMSCISGTSLLKISMQQPDKQTFFPIHWFNSFQMTWLPPTLGDLLNLATMLPFWNCLSRSCNLHLEHSALTWSFDQSWLWSPHQTQQFGSSKEISPWISTCKFGLDSFQK